jgi:ubiquinone/menaquinone biosynthesis C-methylase UbiE
LSNFLAPLLRLFFSLLYHQFARAYDVVAALVSFGEWNSWVLSVLDFVQGRNVLEIGHGPGHLLERMSLKDLKVVGLDESKQMVGLVFGRLSEFGGGVLLVNGYAQFLPFQSSCFDQVVSTFPSDFIYQPQSLSEIYRVLIPGGQLIVLPVAWITGRAWFRRIASWLFKITGQSPEWDKNLTLPFHKAGFIIEEHRIIRKNSQLLVIVATKSDKLTTN